MTLFISKRISAGANYAHLNLHSLSLCLVVLFVLLSQNASAQLCDKKTMVFFESDHYSVQEKEEQKLKALTSQFTEKTDTFLLEIYAFTDSVASADYNYKLAKNRFKSIVAYLKKNSACHFEILERVRGEAMPLSSNATEEGRAKNRRVEIFYFKMSDGRIVLKGKRGMEVAVERDFFGDKGVCECNPKLTEIYTNDEAARAGISMESSQGCPLTTGGMIKITYTDMDENKCRTAIIKIAAEKYDEEMEIWNSTPIANSKSMSKWFREKSGQLEYDEKTKIYTMTVKLCFGSWVNLDKVGASDRGNGCQDSAAVVALPELNRSSRKGRDYRVIKSRIKTKEGDAVVAMAKFSYRGRGTVQFADSGMSKDKIGYYFSGNLDKYVAECDSGRCAARKECWCYEIPLSAYTKIIYFQKKKPFVLKVPMKFRKYSVRLFIPGADSVISIAPVKGSMRKYSFDQPLPNTYVVLYKEASKANDKRAYDYQVDLEKVKKRFSKRKKVYKAKVKRKQLRNRV